MRTTLAAAAALAWAAGLGLAGQATAKDLLGVACSSPPALHCPDKDCPADLIGNLGNAVEPKTGRKFFLDYPCDLKAGEKVTLVLALHGGGSIGNWQRHYFPIMDFKEKFRLVIATPTGPGGTWSPERDDAYLHNIVEALEGALGKGNVKAFWLAGHSLGGQTANRLITTDPFFKSRLTGWVSLSGGRLGSKREEVRAPIPTGSGGPGGPPPPPPGAPPGALRLVADASVLPDYPFSHIYETGGHELTPAGLPGDSKWAQKLKCGAQTKGPQVVDAKAGYVNDTRPQPNPNPIWGGKARPGTAQVYLYPKCEGGRVVADIVRADKGHTEGLEPKVTEEIVQLMVAAK
jgi:pimeloyl-ACP methyl ester carboxylesterase